MDKINEKVLICGVIKNCGERLEGNIHHAIQTGNLFSKYKIIIYENNSTDNTKEKLNLFTTNSSIHIISENISDEQIKTNSKIWAYTEITQSDHSCRIEQICNARNKVITEINKPIYQEYSYVIWIDLDSINGWDLNGIIDSFNKKLLWDAIFANGINSNSFCYYDYYAYRNKECIFGPEIIGEYFWHSIKQFTIDINSNLMPVYSAFGGIGIYKKHLFKLFKYDCLVTDDIKKFYNKILSNETFDENIKQIIKSPDTKFPAGYLDQDNTNIFWKANSGYNQPVICEHVTLNLALINNGYKLFINPKLGYFH